ncbi:DUF115 domain-containing protein [Treponema sp. OttesenSCG-928-L16]|nr:DUF115 domain-containing protein [Treponema sp. OttesenSCG-928-L16]
MDRSFCFDRNLLALSASDPELCSRLSAAETTNGHYLFLESRSGETVPAMVDRIGKARPLHSLVDPRREGERLVSTISGEGCLIFMGLGGAFHIEAALDREDIQLILIIDYGIDGMAELLSSKEYIRIFNDPRVRLCVDPDRESLRKYILETYIPSFYGGIRTMPLRTRTDLDPRPFHEAGEGIKSAIDDISGDYSVQAHFGKRWFSNIIRNIYCSTDKTGIIAPIRRAAVSAAGPSLEMQLPLIEQRRSSFYLIAADTSLPVLLSAGIIPDAVISIDCQHISYYHFMAGLPAHIPLFLDLASPPLLASLTDKAVFFSGGHPLTRYISLAWRSFPVIDTSGANVTYAAVSLAEALGAEEIELFGADFSYPQGQSYARGTYIHPFFQNRQDRLSPLEAAFSAFLFRSPSLEKKQVPPSWYYETRSLSLYRHKLEAKAAAGQARIIQHPGLGPGLKLGNEQEWKKGTGILPVFSAGKAAGSPKDFLRKYSEDIGALPAGGKALIPYLSALSGAQYRVFTSLLPLAAALKKKEPGLAGADLLGEAKRTAVREIKEVLETPARLGRFRQKGN